MNFAHHREYILSHITYQCQLLNGMTLNLNALGKSQDEEKPANVNCKQPLFFFQSRAWSFACLGRFARRTKEKGTAQQSTANEAFVLSAILFALATAHSRPQTRQGPSHVFKCCVAPGGDSLEQASRKITIKPLRETNVSVAQA